MLIFWKCLMFFFGNVQGAKLNKKSKRLAKSNVKQEINFLAKELEVDKDEFTVHDVFIFNFRRLIRLSEVNFCPKIKS